MLQNDIAVYQIIHKYNFCVGRVWLISSVIKIQLKKSQY